MRIELKKILSALLPALLLVPLTCGPLSTDQTEDQEGKAEPDQESYGVILTEMKGPVKNWVFHADYVATYNEDNFSRASVVKVEFFDDEGKPFSTIVADSGLIYEQSKDLTARGNVEMVTSDGTKLETEELRWDNKGNKILSDRFVRITEGDNVITGIGLESDPRLDQFEIKQQISGRLYQEPAETDTGP